MIFWTLWAIDACVAAAALFFFVWGLADGSVSSFNIGLWMALLGAVAVIVGGSVWLKSAGLKGLAIALLLVLAVPAVLYALFILLVVTSGTSWN